jgi:hypothetical protein
VSSMDMSRASETHLQARWNTVSSSPSAGLRISEPREISAAMRTIRVCRTPLSPQATSRIASSSWRTHSVSCSCARTSAILQQILTRMISLSSCLFNGCCVIICSPRMPTYIDKAVSPI